MFCLLRSLFLMRLSCLCWTLAAMACLRYLLPRYGAAAFLCAAAFVDAFADGGSKRVGHRPFFFKYCAVYMSRMAYKSRMVYI